MHRKGTPRVHQCAYVFLVGYCYHHYSGLWGYSARNGGLKVFVALMNILLLQKMGKKRIINMNCGLYIRKDFSPKRTKGDKERF